MYAGLFCFETDQLGPVKRERQWLMNDRFLIRRDGKSGDKPPCQIAFDDRQR